MYKDRDDKFVCLMDIALMGMKQLKAAGKLDDMEVSDEINACSIVVPVVVDGVEEEWLVILQERDTQPSYRDRAIRWCCYMSWRCYQRSALRKRLRIPGYESYRCG